MTATVRDGLLPVEEAHLLDQAVAFLQATYMPRAHLDLAVHHLQAAAAHLRAPGAPVLRHVGCDMWEVGLMGRTTCVRAKAWALPLFHMALAGEIEQANTCLSLVATPCRALGDTVRKQRERLVSKLSRVAPDLASALLAIEVSNKAELSLSRVVDVITE